MIRLLLLAVIVVYSIPASCQTIYKTTKRSIEDNGVVIPWEDSNSLIIDNKFQDVSILNEDTVVFTVHYVKVIDEQTVKYNVSDPCDNKCVILFFVRDNVDFIGLFYPNKSVVYSVIRLKR